MRLAFTKMEAAGNDYIYVDGIERHLPDADWPALARDLSRRRHSVGADGIILILPSESADFRMRLFNADGSEGDMCGNGVRCVGAYVWERGLIGVDSFSVETPDGPVTVRVQPEDGELSVDALMTPPRFLRGEIPMTGQPEESGLAAELEVGGRSVPVDALRLGNPHCVLFVRDVYAVDVATLGPLLESHPAFPERTNVEFVEVADRDALRVRVWERGSGITAACGTGASAAAVCAILRGRVTSPVRVEMPGGDLRVEWDEAQRLHLCGIVREVYRGSLEIPGELLMTGDFETGGGRGR